jgi:hypothetical protein
MSAIASEQGRAAVQAWQQTVNAAWQRQAEQLAGPEPAVPANVEGAEQTFFGPPPPGAQRQIIDTNATVPGGLDGIVVNRMYIADRLAAFNQLYGDDRGQSVDPSASSRVAMAWDTSNGKVSITVYPSTVHENSIFQEQSPYTVPRQVDPWPITVGQDSLGTNFSNNFVVNSEPGRVDVKYDLINSGLPDPFRWGAVQGETSMSVTDNEIVGDAHGEDYPDREVIQYRSDGARILHTSPMAEGGAVGTPIFGTDYDTPRGEWRAPR